MNTKAFATTLSVAAATMALTLAAFLPAGVTADDPPAAVPPENAWPVLETAGCRLTLRPAETTAPGEASAMELHAVNTTNRPVELKATVSQLSQAAADMGSRMGPVSVQIWQDSYSLSLEPGQTKTVKVDAPKAAEAGGAQAPSQTIAFLGSQVFYVLSVGDKQVSTPRTMVLGDAVPQTNRQAPPR